MACLAACATPQRPLAETEAPDIVLFVTDAADSAQAVSLLAPEGVHFLHGFASADDPGAVLTALLTSHWPGATGAPDSIPGVLGLYGFRSAAWLRPGLAVDPTVARHFTTALDVAEAGARAEAAAAWLADAPEPFLLVVDVDAAGITRVREGLARRGLRDRTLTLLVGAVGDDAPMVLLHPRMPAESRGVVDPAPCSTMDVLPTLVVAGGGTAPSDVQGLVLRGTGDPARVVFRVNADGSLEARSAAAHLRVGSATT